MSDSESDREREEATPNTLVTRSRSAGAITALAARYTWSDVVNRPRNWCVGFFATFIVVFFVGLILLGISKTPVIFLRFAEQSTGEMDALIYGGGNTPFLNYTQMAPTIAKNAQYTSATLPRWLLRGEISNANDPVGGVVADIVQPTNNSTSDGNTTTTTTPSVLTYVLIAETLRETSVGVGRAWPYRPIGFAETQVLQTSLDFIGVPPNQGNRATLALNLEELLKQQGLDANTAIRDIAANNAASNSGSSAVDPVTANTSIPVIVNGANVTIPLSDLIGGVVAAAGGSSAQAAAATSQTADAMNAALALQTGNLTSLLTDSTISSILQPSIGLTVADGVTNAYGKYPTALGNMAIMDSRYLIAAVLEQSCYDAAGSLIPTAAGTTGTSTANPVTAMLSNVRLNDYAVIVVAMMRDRFNVYYTKTAGRTKKMIQFSNDLLYSIGLDFEGSISYPLATALTAFDFFQLYLSSIFTAVIAVVIILGALLVYTLLLTNVEERSFEVAMLRAQGMDRPQLLTLLASQTIAFVVPGIAVAVAFLFIANAIIEVILSDLTYSPRETARITVESIVVPVLVGLLVPIFANLGPVTSVVSASLRDALNVYRNAATETAVTVSKLAEMGLAPWQTLAGIVLVVGGFVVYYVIPMSFIFENLTLFFTVMNLILVAMMVGLCLITYTLQPIFERGILYMLLWGDEKRLGPLIRKNFSAHGDRNSKAFLLFTLSAACVIFGGVLFTMLANSLGHSYRSINGADLSVTASDFDVPLNKTAIDVTLQRELANKKVVSWSYVTYTLNQYPQVNANTKLASVIGFPTQTLDLIGVDENFQKTVYTKYVDFAETEGDIDYGRVNNDEGRGSKPDVFQSLTTDPPTQQFQSTGAVYTGFPPTLTKPDISEKAQVIIPVVLASAAQKVLGMSAGGAGTITFGYQTGQSGSQTTTTTVFLATVRALADGVSGYKAMSKLESYFSSSPMITSVDAFHQLVNANQVDYATALAQNSTLVAYDANAVTEIRYARLLVKLNPAIAGNKGERTSLVNRLQVSLDPYSHSTVVTPDLVDSISSAVDLIIVFFYFVCIVAVILDTFMLWLTFVSNVQLNAWSFGVLRSLGFTAAQLTRAFVYEALTLVIGSFIIGTIVGFIVAITVVLQMNLILQSPFEINFPYGLFGFLLGLSLISAVVGSVVPSRAVSSRPIAVVLKKG